GVTGDTSWYDKNGIKCMTCQRALDKHLIPVSACKNNASWYSIWEFDYYFGVKSRTINKFVHLGKLKARVVPREDGGVHFQLFLIKDNPGVLPEKPKSHLVEDKDGLTHVEYEKVEFPLFDAK
ncbi:MAG: hypothetical protein V1846_00850, partial [Candidatus Komeilibacteria bacterium]